MALNRWSGSITIAELADEPAFSEDMEALLADIDTAISGDSHDSGDSGNSGTSGSSRGSGGGGAPDVIIDLKAVRHLNSSNLAQLLLLRRKLHAADRRLRICAVRDTVWSVLLTTGLDGVFEFTEDVSTSLASLQIEG